jgi:phage-related protein
LSTPKVTKILKDVQWCGDSLEIIRQWPIGVRASIGEDLRRLQKGENHATRNHFQAWLQMRLNFEIRTKMALIEPSM